jgi:8-oxo-dGTP pyrophosphatase MutT (NUDIX family)
VSADDNRAMISLAFTTDPYGGLHIDPEQTQALATPLHDALRDALPSWTDAGHRLVWLKLPIAASARIPDAVDNGFVFHHARPDYVMLVRRLQPNAFVPTDASHFIGAGAVVINAARELLVIRERYGGSSNRKPFFKMPGGLLDPGENLVAGVMREVLEETGVQTRFESVVCFRHQHGYRYGKSDFYFVCRLSPISDEVNADPEEIAEARWMPVDEYLDSDLTHAFNKHIVRMAVEREGALPTHIDGYTLDPAKMEVFTL